MSLLFDPFADLNRSNREKCDNGYTLEDLSSTAHEVFRKIVGDNQFIRNLPWNSLQEPDKEMWRPLAQMAMCLFDLREEGAEVTISVSQTACNFYRQFTVSCAAPEYQTLPESHHVAWQALVRHLGNLIDSDGNLDFPEMEERIVEWAKAKIGSGPQLVLA